MTSDQPLAGRREQILEVAAPLFARHGFHGASVDELGAAAGVTGPALYRHFRAKEEILAELLVSVSERLLRGGRQRVEGAADSSKALAGLVDFHVRFALDEPDVITVQARDLANLPHAAATSVRALQTRYVETWAGAIESLTGCDHTRAIATAHAAFGLMNSTPYSARLPRDEMAELLSSMTLAAIRATAT